MNEEFLSARFEYVKQLAKKLDEEKVLDFGDALKEEFGEIEHLLEEIK